MMRHLKRVLGFTHRTRPVTIEDVDPAEQDPAIKRQSDIATEKLVQEVMAVERRSWEIRQELAAGTLRLVVGGHRGRDRYDEE